MKCSFFEAFLTPKQNMSWVRYRPGGAMSVIPCLTSFISDFFLSCLSGFNLQSNSKVYNNHLYFLKSTKNKHSTEQQQQTTYQYSKAFKKILFKTSFKALNNTFRKVKFTNEAIEKHSSPHKESLLACEQMPCSGFELGGSNKYYWTYFCMCHHDNSSKS